jgi:hypothetical protein
MTDQEPFNLTHRISRFQEKTEKIYSLWLILEINSYSYHFLFGLKFLLIYLDIFGLLGLVGI